MSLALLERKQLRIIQKKKLGGPYIQPIAVPRARGSISFQISTLMQPLYGTSSGSGSYVCICQDDSSSDAGNVQRTKSFAFWAPQENFNIQDFELGKIYGVGSYSKLEEKDVVSSIATVLSDLGFHLSGRVG